MRRIYFLLVLLFIFSNTIFGQNEDTAKVDSLPMWNIGGIGNINFSQGYQENWVEGGESSITTLSVLNLFANYDSKKTNWENTVDLKFGILNLPEEAEWRKNEDNIEINSILNRISYRKWNYSVMLGFKTQFAEGKDYGPDTPVVVSDFMAPGYLTISTGMNYKYKKLFSVLISPLTLKYTFVNDTVLIDQTKYGLEPDKKTRREFGAYIKSKIKFDITEDIQISSKLGLFSNYKNNPQNIDIDWEGNINMKVNKYIVASIMLRIIYDDDIEISTGEYDEQGNEITGPRMQFKELLGLGFSYKF